jgi:hypothetical protein
MMASAERFLWCVLAVYTAFNVTLIVGALLTAAPHRATFNERFGAWDDGAELIFEIAPQHWTYRPCDLIRTYCVIG